MAKDTVTDNEYDGIAASVVAARANHMLSESELQGERALAIAIALRDRIQAQDEQERDPTSAVLAGMLVDELDLAQAARIKQCVATLLNRCQIVNQA